MEEKGPGRAREQRVRKVREGPEECETVWLTTNFQGGAWLKGLSTRFPEGNLSPRLMEPGLEWVSSSVLKFLLSFPRGGDGDRDRDRKPCRTRAIRQLHS